MPDKPNDKTKGWASTLDDEPADAGVQADIARKILALNPSLRDAGVDTMKVVEQTKNADRMKAAAKPAQAAPAARFVDTLAEAKRQLATDEQRLKAELQRLEKTKQELRPLALARFEQWLLANDPDLKSPITQAVLDEEKAFLSALGFQPKKFLEARKKR